ncbi:hypothetical protein Tco_0038901 [Tanacetum coccineum]
MRRIYILKLEFSGVFKVGGFIRIVKASSISNIKTFAYDGRHASSLRGRMRESGGSGEVGVISNSLVVLRKVSRGCEEGGRGGKTRGKEEGEGIGNPRRIDIDFGATSGLQKIGSWITGRLGSVVRYFLNLFFHLCPFCRLGFFTFPIPLRVGVSEKESKEQGEEEKKEVGFGIEAGPS